MVLSEEDGHISQAPKNDGTVEGAAVDAFPMDRIEQWKAEGRKVIYASFGTVASNMTWNWEEADSGGVVCPSQVHGGSPVRQGLLHAPLHAAHGGLWGDPGRRRRAQLWATL